MTWLNVARKITVYKESFRLEEGRWGLATGRDFGYAFWGLASF